MNKYVIFRKIKSWFSRSLVFIVRIYNFNAKLFLHKPYGGFEIKKIAHGFWIKTPIFWFDIYIQKKPAGTPGVYFGVSLL